MLGIKEIEEIIPHRHPFLLIDYIEDYKPGEYAVGYKCVTFREDFFRGHFPQEPVMPGVLTVEALAQEYLSNCGGKKEQAAEQLIRMQVTKCTTTGFLTGLGGLITLPATITADIGSSMYVQIRMIAAIAVMGGYSLQDDVVKSMVFATLLKVEVGNLLKQVGVKTANRASLQLLKKLPGTVLTKINQKLGFRFLTKFGQKGVINLVKVVPVAGGVVNGGLNLVETKAIGKRAMKVFLLK